MTVLLKTYQTMTVTAPSTGDGFYWIKGNPGDAPGAPVDVPAGTSVTIGPFNSDVNYHLQNLSYTIVNATFVNPINSTKLSNITNSATGTQIATAVNGILAILIAAGLMASS